MEKIVLISCCKRKLPTIAKVEDLYISSLFRYSLKYGRSLRPNKIFILSAKHGLLELEQRKKHYDQTLNSFNAKGKRKWGKKVIIQLAKKTNLKRDIFIILAGKVYLNPIRKSLTNIKEPLEELNYGRRLKWLKDKVGSI